MDFTVVPLEPQRPGTLPEPGTRRIPRWLQVAGIGAVVAAVFGYVAIAGGGPSATPVPPVEPTASAGPDISQWPMQGQTCGGLDSPTIQSAPLDQKTGISVFVGGVLQKVDLDLGNVSAIPSMGLAPGESVLDVASDNTDTFVLVASCTGGPTSQRVIRVDAAGTVISTPTGRVDRLLQGGNRVWGVRDSATSYGQSTVDPFYGGGSVVLPAGLLPFGAYGDLIIGSRTAVGGAISDEIVLYDTAKEAVTTTIGDRSTSGPADPSIDPLSVTNLLFAGSGFVVWTEAPCGGVAVCVVHEHNLTTGTEVTTKLTIPAGRAFAPQAVSADGRRLAGRLTRALPDRRFRDDFVTGADADVAVLDLKALRFASLPGITAPPHSVIELAFAADGGWLVIAVNQARVTRLLVWRTGLSQPLESSAAIEGSWAWAPSIYVSAG